MGQEAAFDNHQLRDGTGGAGFCDSEGRGGEGFPKGVVLENAVRRGDERNDGDVFVRLRFTELNRPATEILLRFPCVSFLCGRRGTSPAFFTPRTNLTRPNQPPPPLLNWLECRFSEFTSTNLTDGV
jgi:hypothetical protein